MLDAERLGTFRGYASYDKSIAPICGRIPITFVPGMLHRHNIVMIAAQIHRSGRFARFFPRMTCTLYSSIPYLFSDNVLRGTRTRVSDTLRTRLPPGSFPFGRKDDLP